MKLEKISDLANKNITVMGLGLNGGGLASTIFLAKNRANVTVTDLRSFEELQPTIEKLKQYPFFDKIKFVLGEHREEDFSSADIVIKNPAIRANNKYLALAKHVESDLSLFLRFAKNPIIAVTGSKGKSTTVSALSHILQKSLPKSFLGGNITVSPLSFIEEALVNQNAPVVLELSSWQLADINFIETQNAEIFFKPKVSLITNIMHDHQNAYNCFDDYVKDKELIFKNQDSSDYFVCGDGKYCKRFLKNCKAKSIVLKNFNVKSGKVVLQKNKFSLLPKTLLVSGDHNRRNCLFAAAACSLFGIEESEITSALSSFSGIAYRMENVATSYVGNTKVLWINDSAATMPDAMLASCKSYKLPIFLIAGGTDKELIFSPFKKLPKNVVKTFLLSGSASEKILPLLKKSQFGGVFNSLSEAALQAIAEIEKNKFAEVVMLLSPGAASFGLFKNEFDRGDKFKDLALLYSKKCGKI